MATAYLTDTRVEDGKRVPSVVKTSPHEDVPYALEKTIDLVFGSN